MNHRFGTFEPPLRILPYLGAIRPGFILGLGGLKPGTPWQVGPRIPSKKNKNSAEIVYILVAQALQMPVPKPGCSTCL